MIYFCITISIIIGILDGVSKIQDARTNEPIKTTNNLFKYITNTKY